MSKVIIKVNTFMKTKEFTDICNFIYNQYKERDIVVVPPYCDVYIVDGKPEIKIEKPVEKRCMTCKFDSESGCTYSGDLCDMNYEHWETNDGPDRKTT